jgi:plasmid stability protein
VTYFHIVDMVIHMKTTLNIENGVMRDLKMRAAREGRTMSELVETALRRLLDERPVEKDLPPLPTLMARELVDVSDRDALYRAMEEP